MNSMKWKKVGHPILFMWISPKPTELHHWLIFHFKENIERVAPCFFFSFCRFVSKGSNQFEAWSGVYFRIERENQALDILSVEVKKKKKRASVPTEISELARAWWQLGDKRCHITKEREQSLPLYWIQRIRVELWADRTYGREVWEEKKKKASNKQTDFSPFFMFFFFFF